MQAPKNAPRLWLLMSFFSLFLCMFVVVLYDTQITHGAEYLEQSIRTITRKETVEAARGVITDRNGLPMVSNYSTYQLTFDTTAVEDDETNHAILRLVLLCKEHGLTWTDNLPITSYPPYVFTVDSFSSTQRNRFLKYLQDLELVPQTWTKDDLTNESLPRIGLTPTKLLQLMATEYELSSQLTDAEKRMVLGMQYELNLRKIMNINPYIMVEDISLELISLINDGQFQGARVSSATAREYQTSYAAHILGTVGPIYDTDYEELKPLGYALDDDIGKSGVEYAFEEYLRGIDGQRIVSTNADGKITSELYTVEPKPGNTVELTIDLKLQQAVETALANTVDSMTKKDGIVRGAGAAVVAVGTGEVLSLASYPTYNLSTYNKDYTELSADPANPLFNRATQGTYAPGSTFKPVTAVAALETGVITPDTKLYCDGAFHYPNADFYVKCWINPGAHGSLDVVDAMRVSCNDFLCELGYRTGITELNNYARAFGLGSSTGIEIGDNPGVLASPEHSIAVGSKWYGGNTVQSAIGQSDHLFTPLQLANFVATLVSGGDLYNAHLLKAVKSYDNTEMITTGEQAPISSLNISDSTLSAVMQGMHELTKTSLASSFKNCVVTAGAKTGTAQISTSVKNTGTFICFAPYEDPEVAVAIVIEKGGSGGALASTAVEILNAYFTEEEIGTIILGENQLLQ